MALVYVARTTAGSSVNLSRQGLGMRIEDFPVEVQRVTGPGAGGIAQVRALPGVDEIVEASPQPYVTVYLPAATRPR